jgi:molecular chaperone GrpE (heat shock protein)
VKRGVCKRHGAFKDVPPTVQEQDEESWGGDDQAMTEYGDSDGELGGENIDTREDDRVHELECENQALKAKLAEMAAKLAAAESQNARMMI